jgi:hypothetical protein
MIYSKIRVAESGCIFTSYHLASGTKHTQKAPKGRNALIDLQQDTMKND